MSTTKTSKNGSNNAGRKSSISPLCFGILWWRLLALVKQLLTGSIRFPAEAFIPQHGFGECSQSIDKLFPTGCQTGKYKVADSSKTLATDATVFHKNWGKMGLTTSQTVGAIHLYWWHNRWKEMTVATKKFQTMKISTYGFNTTIDKSATYSAKQPF